VHLDLGEPGGPVIRLAGEIDMLVSDDMRAAGEEAVAHTPEGGRVTIDLAEVTFLDSTGIGSLVAISNAARAKDVPLVLRSVPERITKLLAITGLDGVFATEP
jgi:anti-anti-sigma factor